MSKPTWQIDWDKVKNIDDVIRILKELRIGFYGELQDFKSVEDLLTFKYPKDKK